jgi:uncharacterized protein (TIGR00251 family)
VNFSARPWRAAAGGILLDIRVTPKGGRDAIDGVEMLANGQVVLKLRVRAAPTDGDANDAVNRLIAKSVGVAKSNVTLERGASARVKTLRIVGDDVAIAASLEAAIGGKQEKQ